MEEVKSKILLKLLFAQQLNEIWANPSDSAGNFFTPVYFQLQISISLLLWSTECRIYITGIQSTTTGKSRLASSPPNLKSWMQV